MSIYDQLGCTSKLSPEAIKNYSGNMHPFAKELIDLCAKFKLARELLKASRKTTGGANGEFVREIKELTKKHLKMNIEEFSIVQDDSVNAYAYIPDINKKNPMFRNMMWWMNDKDAKGILNTSDKMVGWCDTVKVELGGDFSNVPCRVGLHTGTVDKLSAGAIAFIICHEYGHLWSAFEFVATGVFRNVALLAACQDMKNDWENVNKSTITSVLVGKSSDSDLEIKTVDDLDKFIAMQIADNLKSSSDMAKAAYDNTAAESYADQFAVRLGLGSYGNEGLLELYTGAGMAYKTGSIIATMTKIVYIVIEIFLVATSLMSGNLIIGIFCYGLLSYMGALGDQNFSYDIFEDRINRIRNELIAKLKISNDKNEKKLLLDEISDISDTIRSYKNVNTSLIGAAVLKVVVPYFRNNINKKQLQQSYERLINNELYVVGNKFNNLRA